MSKTGNNSLANHHGLISHVTKPNTDGELAHVYAKRDKN